MKLLARLFVTNLLLGVFGVAAAGLLFYVTIRAVAQTQAREAGGQQVSQTLTSLDRFLYERYHELQSLGAHAEYNKALARAASSADKIAAAHSLSDAQAASTFWNNFSLLGTAGAAVAAAPANNQADLPAQGGAVDALFKQALAGHTVYSQAIRTHGSGQPTIIIMTPIRTGSTVTGVLEGEIAWSGVLQILQTSPRPAILLDPQGLLLGRSSSDTSRLLEKNYAQAAAFGRIKQAASGSAELSSLDHAGQTDLISHGIEPGFLDYHGNGWILAVSQPISPLLSLHQQAGLILAALFAGLTVAGALALFVVLSRRVIKPIKLLTAAITRISLGDLSQTVPVTSKDELGILGRDFNEMTHQLATTHRNLQEATRIAQEGRAQLESSINGLRQGFILTDAKGKLLLTNQAAREMVQSRQPGDEDHPAGAISLDQVVAVLPPDLHLADQIKQTLEARKQAKFPTVPLGGRYLNVYLSPVVYEDKAIGCALLLEDITEERIMQRSRDEFFSIASHELRTPLTAIRGNTDLLNQYYPEALKDPDVKEMVGDIHESSIRLIEIVNDFLDASSLEQNKMNFSQETFAVEPVIERIIYEMAGMSRSKKVALNFDQNTLGKLPAVKADQNRVKQILYNLIGNALKFTQAGSVTINCLVEKKFVKVCVTDTGQGITLEGQQLLFHKFQQTTKSILTRDNTRGTGLGLYISKLLINHMGGELKLEHSEAGKGSTFSFTLPISDQPLGTGAANQSLSASGQDSSAAKAVGQIETTPATPAPDAAPAAQPPTPAPATKPEPAPAEPAPTPTPSTPDPARAPTPTPPPALAPEAVSVKVKTKTTKPRARKAPKTPPAEH